MELNLQRQSITINEVVYDGQVEQPIECDALLPDYCPDIIKVLKCAVSTNIASTTLSGDRLTIEGMAVAHVYYSSDTGALRHTEYKIPFGKAVDLRGAPQAPVVTVIPRVDYVNCRAVNQRRIDIRGALSLGVKVNDRKEEQVVSDASGGGLQIRRDLVKITEIVAQTDTQFTIQEDLECGLGKPAIGNVVRVGHQVKLTDYKVVAGKVVAKGEYLLRASYQPVDDGNLEVMEYTLPISQIIDCDGIDEECVCEVELHAVSCDLMPKSDEAGEYRGFSLDARVRAVITAHRHKEVPVASDCYSTRYDCGCKQKPVSFLRLVDVVRETVSHKTSLDLPENVDCVLDSWCEVEDLTWKWENGSLACAVSLTVSMFAKMEDGECLYFEQPCDVTHDIPLSSECDSVLFDPTCDVLTSAYNLVGKEKIDIRCELLLRGCVYSTVRHSSIDDIQLDEGKEKVKVQNKLYLYYADEGESIWDIAKHYNTSANAIWEENGVEDDILPGKCMLLIPIL